MLVGTMEEVGLVDNFKLQVVVVAQGFKMLRYLYPNEFDAWEVKHCIFDGPATTIKLL